MGDKTHPWGVPVFKINSFDLILFTQTVYGRSRKNALTQRTMLGLTSRSKRRERSICVRRVLKAELKSINKILINVPLWSRW